MAQASSPVIQQTHRPEACATTCHSNSLHASIRAWIVFLQAAIEEAKKGLAEGGIPIGSVLVLDGKIIGRGHNQRVQRGSVIHHAEMNCLENAGRLKASIYQRCILYSTLSPCPMCSGAILLYKIPHVVVGENVTFQGPEAYIRSQGVQVEVLQDPVCIQLMRDFIAARTGTLERGHRGVSFIGFFTRASFYFYNTNAKADRFVEVIKEIQKFFGQ